MRVENIRFVFNRRQLGLSSREVRLLHRQTAIKTRRIFAGCAGEMDNERWAGDGSLRVQEEAYPAGERVVVRVVGIVVVIGATTTAHAAPFDTPCTCSLLSATLCHTRCSLACTTPIIRRPHQFANIAR
jgi:hypothetical protein